ncbi:MAG: PKD domain-containing protein [Bacteroidetes bacterium]|nr:MAG: PKD domain-containing protein [Bacteroidota bacterium]
MTFLSRICLAFCTCLLLISFNTYSQVNADFSADITADCAPAIVNFTSTSTGSGINSYLWDFGDGTGTSNLQNPAHTFSTPGVYTVTLTVSNGVSSDTEVKTGYITVFRNPVASFSFSNDSVCSGTMVTMTSTSTPGDASINQYNWTFNDGTPPVSGVSTVNHVFNTTSSSVQSYFPNLLINDANGCNSSNSDTIWVFPQPTASFTPNPLSACTAPATVNFSNTSTGTSVYNWNFGDTASGSANTSSLANPSHTFNSTGNYIVTLTAGIPGCSDNMSQIITVAQPIASFDVSDTVVCIGDTVQFTNTGTSGSYFWNFGDPGSGGNNVSNLENPIHLFSTAGQRTITLNTVVGACSNTFTRTITVRNNPVPSLTTSGRTSCSIPFNVNFSDTSSANVSWFWTFGDPSSGSSDTSIIRNPSHTYTAFGNYTINLTVEDAFGCIGSAIFPNYIQITPPTVSFLQTDSGCVGDSFNFSAFVNSPADPVITNYAWDFGDGSPVQNVNTSTIQHVYNTAGIYDVELTITTQSGCTATLLQPAFIKVGTVPAAAIQITPDTICFKQSFTFTDLTPQPVTGWLWSFGDGGGSNQQNPTHQFNIDTSGITDPFDIQLIAFYNGCPDTIVVSDMIAVTGPIPDFSFTQTCASPYSVAFTNESGGATSYSWNFGDGSAPSVQTDPTHVYSSRGTYSVVLTAVSSSSGCSVDSTYTVQITDPQAVISSNTSSGCRPLNVQFDGSGSIDNSQVVWYFGEGIPFVNDTAYVLNPVHLYNTPGNYTVTLVVTDIHGCTNSTTAPITVNGPTAAFMASPFSGCAPLNNVTFTDTSLTAGSAIVRWIWNFGTRIDTTTSGTATNSYPSPGNYTVGLTVEDANGCVHSTTYTNYIRATQPVPVITLSNDTACSNTFTQINVNPGPFVAAPLTYNWNYGDGITETTNSVPVNHFYANNGNYQISLTVTDANGCTGSTQKDLFVYTTPASFSTTLSDTCVERNGIKQAQINAVFVSDSNLYASNYSWDLTVNNFSGPNFSTAVYEYAVPPGAYDVTFILTNRFGCRDTAFRPGLVVVPVPTGSFTLTPDSGCRPLTVNFQGNTSNAAFYAWDFGDGNVILNSTDLNITHIYRNTGVFIPQFYLGFQLPSSGSFCYVPVPNADTIQVTSLVGVNIVQDTLFIRDGETQPVEVVVQNSAGQSLVYNWSPTGLVTPDPSIPGTFLASSSDPSAYYYVDVAYGASGCSGIDSVFVVFIPCETLELIPNVFTPNGDNKNDFYEFDELCNFEDFRIIIYNRWGKIMFESTDPKFKWDGKDKNGNLASEGVYYYVMHAKTKDVKGYIQLIRE